MAGPRGPRKRQLRAGKRPRKAAKVRAEIRAAEKATKIEEIKEVEHLPPHTASVVVDSAPLSEVGGPADDGALPPKKIKVSAAVKRAADRAEATSAGKELPPVSTEGVDPALLADRAAKEAKEAKEAGEAVEPEGSAEDPATAPIIGPGGAHIFPLPGRTGKGGRPSDFNEEYVPIARDLCAGGATDAVLADFFGCSIGAIYRWKAAHLEFRKAIFEGKQEYRDAQDDNVERSLHQRATGYVQVTEKIMAYKGRIMRVQFEEHVPGDVAAAKLWLANRRPDKWRVDPDKGGNDGLTVNAIGDAAVLEIARRMGQVLLEAQRAEKTIEGDAVDVSAAT